jgi:plastocyanin
MRTTPKMHTGKLLWPLRTMFGVLFITSFTLGVPAAMVHAATAAKEGVKVSIVNFAFTPAEITIAPGESVTWTNDDGAPHGLEYHDGAPGTDLLLPGASFSRRFDQPGTYDYNCSIHPYMTGRVVVRAQ